MATYSMWNPYAKGVLKVAPIKISKDSTYLTPENITEDYFLEPLTDIVDICGVNPTSIKFSKNTNSSESSGRTIDLNMHKDILGRVRDFTLTFPPMPQKKYEFLENLFSGKTENIWRNKDTNELEAEIDESTSIEVTEYVVWYYIEILTPESEVPIKEIVYVGDSSFSDIEIYYRNALEYSTEFGVDPNFSSIIETTFAKNVSVNLIGKNRIKNIGYNPENYANTEE